MMRTDNISLAESEQIIKKFFQVKFDTKKIVKVFKQTRQRRVVLSHIKTRFRELLLDMQADLLRVGKIQQLKFFDNWNSDMNQRAIKLHDILTVQSIDDFYNYFCYKLSFVQKQRCEKSDMILNPLNSQRKYKIYRQFYDYFNRKGILNIRVDFNKIQNRKFDKSLYIYSNVRYQHSGGFRSQNYRDVVLEQKKNVHMQIMEEIKKIFIEKKYI